MENIESSSLTKGCFVHIPNKHKRKKSSNAPKHPDCEVFSKVSLWEDIDKKIKQIEKKSYIETFDGIIQFIKSCFSSPLTEKPSEETEIPSAVLIMGVNMSDHSNLFHLLEKHLHSHEIPSTVILESKKCSNLQNMLLVIVTELITKYKEFLPDFDVLLKKQDCSFSKLHECLESLAGKYQSPRKMKSQSASKRFKSLSKQIVFLLQDVESFSPDVLREFILLCKIYSGRLPIVLVFGMSTAMVTLHNILPQKALCCLGVETFYSVPATEYLSKIIDEVIICPEQPFKLGHRLFQLVVDTVLYHDFSVTNLKYLLKFALLEHLYGKSVTTLCCSESDIEEKVQQCSNEDLQAIKLLPSLTKFQDNNPQYASCKSNNTVFKESIIGFVKNLYHHQRTSLVLLKILHCFTKDLPNYPLGKHLRELYVLSLHKEIHTTDAFLETQKLLKMQSQQSLLFKLEQSIKILEESECSNSVLNETMQILQNCLEKLKKLTDEDFEKNTPEPLQLGSEQIISRFQLQEKIQKSIKLKRSNFDATRNEVIGHLLLIFKNIIPPIHLPLNEIFYFDDVSSVKKHLMAVPRVASCFALSNPDYYLRCSCCKVVEAEEVSPSMPDISILYKLHLESGKLINLCDWLESFKAIKNCEENSRSRRKGKNKSNENDLNIRFLQAVTELQMLGFIKPTKRKTDHVARLTFGSF